MNELSTYQENLPAKIEELSKFVLVGREKLTVVKAEIRAIDKVNLAREVRDQKRDEARMLSEALLDAEVKLGEMLDGLPKASGGDRKSEVFKNDTAVDFEKKKPKHEVIQDLGFSQKQAERFETLAKNKDLVEQVKAEARENDDLPTRTQVLNLAKVRNEKFKQEYQQIDENFDALDKYRGIFSPIIRFNLDSMPKVIAALEETSRNMKTDRVEEEIHHIDNVIGTLNTIKVHLIKAKGVKNGKK